jgi:hypothetical protein
MSDHRPKHVELIGIINKPLLLHLVGVYVIYINDARSNKYQSSEDLLCEIQCDNHRQRVWNRVSFKKNSLYEGYSAL